MQQPALAVNNMQKIDYRALWQKGARKKRLRLCQRNLK